MAAGGTVIPVTTIHLTALHAGPPCSAAAASERCSGGPHCIGARALAFLTGPLQLRMPSGTADSSCITSALRPVYPKREPEKGRLTPVHCTGDKEMNCEGISQTALPIKFWQSMATVIVPVHEMRPSQAAGGESEEERSVWCEHREASAAHGKAVEDKLYLQHMAHDEKISLKDPIERRSVRVLLYAVRAFQRLDLSLGKVENLKLRRKACSPHSSSRIGGHQRLLWNTSA